MTSGRRGFKALLDFDSFDAINFSEIARKWLRQSAESLAPELWAELQSSLPLGPAAEWDQPHGRPGGVWAYITAHAEGDDLRSKVYSPESLQWLLNQSEARPLGIAVDLVRLDRYGVPDGGPEDLGGGRLTISVQADEHSEYFRLQAVSTLPGAEGNPFDDRLADRWAQNLKTIARDVDASFGHVCDDSPSYGATALDHALRRAGGRQSTLQGRRFLRGYSWCTICPKELTRRLGGTRSLARTNAFAAVEELPSGATWLQATESFAEYDDAATRRVFTALAPILPRGLPEQDPFERADGIVRRLVWEDAADVSPKVC